MTIIFHDFKHEITDLFKAYRMAHFSLYNIKSKFYEIKSNNPELQNLVIEDIDFENTVRFTENELNKNSENGIYQRIIAGNTIAMFYNIWEDKYRDMIAKKKGLIKKEVKSNLFAELNIIRQSITHNNYNAITDLNKLKKLDFVGNSKTLKLSSLEVQKIYEYLIIEIESLEIIYCG